MAKASDLLGKSGAGGFAPKPTNKTVIQPPETKEQGEDHSATKIKPIKDAKPAKGGGGHSGIGGAPTSVRPKV
jgi:hypothetical protein